MFVLSLLVHLRGKFSTKDKVALKIAERLMEDFEEVIAIETRDSWDGANLRIVVSRFDPDLVEAVFRRVYEIVEEFGEVGNIVPEIVSRS